jgi:hypothetical protein
MRPLRVFIGYDPREAEAYRVAEHSIRRHASIRVDVQPLILDQLQQAGLYKRPTERREGRLWDGISAAPMATEFALTRFLVPHLAGYRGWALYFDCDFLWRDDVAELLAFADERYALMCVPHAHRSNSTAKMDGQVQTDYYRKNWSSLMLVNCAHLAHAGQLDRVNRWPGLWLHQFRWTQAEDVGWLPEAWNWLEGISKPLAATCAVHYTRGLPSMPGYENSAFAAEWREELDHASRQAPAPDRATA